MNLDGFYRAFEDRYRGSRDLIRERLKVYLPFVEPLRQIYEPTSALDIGCGRGEWLELLQDAGFAAYGVDLDEGMLDACFRRGLPIQHGDGIAHLQSLADESLCVVSGFHVAEHISFEELNALVVQALRVLKPGGLLILETPNPENLVVGSSNFFLDPSHLRPIPPLLLSFIPEYHGFARVRVLRLQELPELHQRSAVTLMDVLGGASPDYAVVAQKEAATELLTRFDAAFASHHGIELHELARRYDEKLEVRMASMEGRLGHTEAQQASQTELLTRMTSLHDRLVDSLESRAHAAEARAAEFLERLGLADSRAGEAEARASEAEVRAGEAEARANELGGNSHYWWQQACGLETERDALRRSWSWRVTAPLRFSGGLLIHPKSTLRHTANSAIRGGIVTFERPLSYLMAQVLRRPKLSQRVDLWLQQRYPHLRQQLVDVSVRHGAKSEEARAEEVKVVGSGHVDPSIQAPAELDNLTSQARQIHADLLAAIENKNRAN